jgi:tRNA A37 threonylcarbamoyladenosine synthetase subunit TsaC/SUA5/YrdC
MPNETFRDGVPSAEQVRADAEAAMDVAMDGGVAIIPLDVAYGIIGTTPDAIRRIFTAKNRSYDKPSGMFSSWRLSSEIHVMEPAKHAIARRMVEEVGLPFSIVAPFDANHALMRAAPPFVLENSSLGGTLDMLLNAGPFHDAIAWLAAERGTPVFGSSANASMKGSKYCLAEIDAPVRAAADIAFDYGRSKYANDESRSSTIVDFADWTVIRVGVQYELLAKGFLDVCGVELIITDTTTMVA